MTPPLKDDSIYIHTNGGFHDIIHACFHKDKRPIISPLVRFTPYKDYIKKKGVCVVARF